tara:strand:- start:2030 stop:2593 length:564 start_codon:yes stop_codon:yes gene_type:complete
MTTTNQLLLQGRRRQVQELWLEGQRPAEIALALGLSVSQVSADIKTVREELYEENQVAIQEHAEQSIAVLRRLEGRLWREVDAADNAGDRLKAFEQIRKTEESIGKVRGILSNRVVADVFHHVKMYDFEDGLPAPMDTDQKILDVPKSPDSSSETPEHLKKPDFDEATTNTNLMPDGTWTDATIIST